MKRGFTLVEILVVISIISLVSSVVMVSVQTARSKARDSTRAQQGEQIGKAMALYEADNGTLPPLTSCDLQNVSSAEGFEVSGCLAVSTAGVNTPQGQAWEEFTSELVPTYISSIPPDPCPGCSTDSGNPPGFEYVPDYAYDTYCLYFDCAGNDDNGFWWDTSYENNSSGNNGGNGGDGGNNNNTPLPVVSFHITPTHAPLDYDVQFVWSSTNATLCTAGTDMPGVPSEWFSPDLAGVFIFKPQYPSGTFWVECTGPGGTDREEATFTLDEPDPLPTVNVTAEFVAFERLAITWSSTDATSCIVSPNTINPPALLPPGFQLGTSGGGTYDVWYSGVFVVSCTGPGGTTEGQAIFNP